MGTWYNGWHYQQQRRTCGKPGCYCAQGELHGPYWYCRTAGGKWEYIGRKLPAALQQEIELRDGLAPALAAHIAQLQADSALLDAVIQGSRPLQLADKQRLDELGYAMLIPAAG